MRSRVCFVYAHSNDVTGQMLATQILVSSLEREFEVSEVRLPALQRTRFRHLRFGVQLISAWVKMFCTARKSDNFHFTVGQTWVSLLRDSIPVWSVRLLNPSAHLMFSLNGHLFTRWKPGSVKAKFFRTFLNKSSVVTVVGPRQKTVLRERLQVTKPTISVLDNPSQVEPLSVEAIRRKHESRPRLRLLHLSNLIETKGFPLYLEALEILSQHAGIPVEASLVGDFVADHYPERFHSQIEAETWIESAIARINTSSRVRVTWTRGAKGKLKQRFFEDAHIFVFPSSYPVEAQPLVLVEALAAGCVVVASTAGEIPSTIPSGVGILLDPCTPAAIAAEIERLSSQEARVRLAECGSKLFASRFSIERYISNFCTFLRNDKKHDQLNR